MGWIVGLGREILKMVPAEITGEWVEQPRFRRLV